jgi:hypothetical protein
MLNPFISLTAGFPVKHKYTTALPKEPRYVMNLKLPHRQMHYLQRPFLKDFTMKTTTKGVKNTLPGHEKLKI